MNYTMIKYILGWIFNFEAAFMAPSFVVGLIYQEKAAFALFATMLLCLAIGTPMVCLRRPKKSGSLCKRRFCECRTELGGTQRYGSAALYFFRFYPASGGCAF